MNTTELFDNYWNTCFHHVFVTASQYPPKDFVSLSQTRKGVCCHNIDIVSWSNPFDVVQPTRETLQEYTVEAVNSTLAMYNKSITTPNITKIPEFSEKDFCFFKNGERVSLKIPTVSDATFTGSVAVGTIPDKPEEDVEFPIIIKNTSEGCSMGIALINSSGSITIYGDLNKTPETSFVGWKTTYITYFLC